MIFLFFVLTMSQKSTALRVELEFIAIFLDYTNQSKEIPIPQFSRNEEELHFFLF